jgi:uncharacterized cupredoxin-like copper-binding protein
LDVISHQASVAPGTGAQVAVELSAGHYVLICNIVGHYQAGMTTAFTVQ